MTFENIKKTYEFSLKRFLRVLWNLCKLVVVTPKKKKLLVISNLKKDNLLKQKRHLLRKIKSHEKDLKRPKTKWRKITELVYSTNVTAMSVKSYF